MRFLLAAMGSHGDVHPFIGLAKTLTARDHSVKLAAQAVFADLIAAAGLEAVPVGSVEDYQTLAADPDLWHSRRGAQVIWRTVLDTLHDAHATLEAAADDDTVVIASTLALAARTAAETRGLRCASVHLQPVVFFSTHQMPQLPGVPRIVRRLPRFVKQRFYDGGERFVLDPMITPGLNEFRAGVGLPPVEKIFSEHLHAPELAVGMWPDWFAPPQPDWPEQARLAGFPLYDEADVTPLPPELEAFLDAGDPPVAFTPGSAMVHGRRFFSTAAVACTRVGLRGLLLTRHAEQVPGDLPAGVLHVPYAPFSRLLPRCRALAFHGGIGTASQALAAGVPTLVMPMSHDQFDNADRLERLGTSATVSVRRFTPRRVARVLTRLTTDPGVADACERAKARLAGEDGCAKAADLLESTFSQGK